MYLRDNGITQLKEPFYIDDTAAISQSSRIEMKPKIKVTRFLISNLRCGGMELIPKINDLQ